MKRNFYTQEKNKKLKAAVLAISILAVCTSIRAESLVTEWNDVTLDAIRAVHPAPTVVSRSLAIVNTAMFDAWAAYDKRAVGTRTGDSLRRPERERTEDNKRVAMSHAAYVVLVDLLPTEEARFKAKMLSLGYPVENKNHYAKTAAWVGTTAAEKIIRYRHKDGSNQLGDMTSTGAPYADYTNYQPVNTPEDLVDPNRWQPLIVPNHIDCHGTTAVQVWCTAHWGRVKPFALHSGRQFRPDAPAKVNEPRYQAQAEEIVKTTAELDDQSKVIAEYWADGPTSELPPGHWVLFAKVISDRDKNDINQDVKMFFSLTNAMFDAGIAAWEAKRHYDSIRPISAIRYLYKGKKIPYYDGKMIKAEDWLPYQPAVVVTPPFAEFVSGHSAFSAAAAEVLKQFTGSDSFGHHVTIPAGQSRVQPGVVPANPITLNWPKFTDAANQAGLSRRYGGIHFEQGDIDGRELGRKVGKVVWRKAKQYWQPEN